MTTTSIRSETALEDLGNIYGHVIVIVHMHLTSGWMRVQVYDVLHIVQFIE